MKPLSDESYRLLGRLTKLGKTPYPKVPKALSDAEIFLQINLENPFPSKVATQNDRRNNSGARVFLNR